MHITEDSEVLWHNVFDTNMNVSGEALVGLAERKDFRVVELLKTRLTPNCYGYALHAAECIADPSLYPYLQNIKQFLDINDEESTNTYFYLVLSNALEVCKPINR